MKPKRLLALFLALVTVLTLSVTALASQSPESAPTPDLLDVTFGNGTVSATTSLASGVTATEYSAGNTVATTSQIGPQSVTIDSKQYSVNGLLKNTDKRAVGVLFNKDEYRAALNDGFTVETAFVMPSTYDSERYIIGATGGGGIGVGFLNNKLFFGAKFGSAWKYAYVNQNPTPGDYVHVTGVYDATESKIYIYVNGEKAGETAVSGTINHGSNAGLVGVGATSGANTTTNVSSYTMPAGTVITEFNMYNSAISAQQAKAAFEKHLIAIGAKEAPAPEPEIEPIPDLLKLTFGNKAVTATSETLEGLTGTATEYKYGNTAKTAIENVIATTVKVDSEDYAVNGYVKNGGTNNLIVKLSNSEDLISSMADGFTLETAFTIPATPTDTDKTILGLARGGGIRVRIGTNGKLNVGIGNYTYTEIDKTFTEGEYVHLVLSYNGTTKKLTAYVNGENNVTSAEISIKSGTYSDCISFGGYLASATNPSESPCSTGVKYTLFNMYNDALTAEEANVVFLKHLKAIGAYTGTITPPSSSEPDEPGAPVVPSDEFVPVLRFVVASDMQKTGSTADANANAKNMVAQAYQIAAADADYKKLDAILIAGDLGEGGYSSTPYADALAQYDAAHDAIVKNIDFDETALLAVMGNHEYYAWRWNSGVDHLSGTDRDNANKAIAKAAREYFNDLYGDYVDYQTGSGYEYLGYHEVINGYHFIGISSDWENRWAFDYNAKTLAWLKTQLDAAVAEDPTKPIFIQGHVGGQDTAAGTGSDLFNDRGSEALDILLRSYPQAVMFSGHSHVSLMTEGSIHQDKYTNINTGSLNNATSQRYYDGDGNIKEMADTRQYNADLYYIVEVDASGNTKITTFDISQNKSVWKTLDLVAPFNTTANFKYTPAQQFASSKDIKFSEDASLQVYAQKNIAKFTFDQADPYLDENSLMATAYKWVLLKGDTVVSSGYCATTFGDDDGLSRKITGAVGNLTPNTQYTLKVYGINPKYDWVIDEASVYSKTPLTATFTTTDGEMSFTPDILNVEIDAAAGTIIDKAGNMTATVNGTPVYRYDDTIDMDVIDLGNGATVKFADYVDDAFAMGYAFTTEAYFSMDSFDIPSSRSYNAVISSMQASGFGFEFLSGGKVQYSVHDGSYRSVKKTVEEDKFYHWVCSYDGQTLTCYVNGQKLGSIAATAPLRFPSDVAKVLFLGADTSASGTPENPADCSVAITRIYSGAATAEQAAELWKAVKGGRDQSVYNDDAVDPELLSWVYYDDCDTEHIKFVGKNGTVHNDHIGCTTDGMLIEMDGDGLQYFKGGHLINSTSHNIIGGIKAVLEFEGSAFKVRTQYRGPIDGGNGDKLDVYIDGNYYDTITGFSGQHDTSLYEVLISGLTNGKHTVELVAVDGRIAIDSFGVGYVQNLISYDVEVQAGQGGSASVVSETINEGEDLTVEFTPDLGYKVADVKVNGESVGAVTEYAIDNIDKDYTIEVTFEKLTYAITLNVGANGTANNQSATVEYGEDYEVTFTPDAGYEIEEVKVDGGSVGVVSSYEFENVLANHTIEVTFKKLTYEVEVIVGQGGTADKTTSTVEYGEDFAVNFTPATGYEVADVKVDGVSVGALTLCELTDITEAHTIKVSFKKLTFQVNVSASQGGTAAADKATVEYGDSVEITITPETGYEIERVLVGNDDMTAAVANNKLTLENVTSDIRASVSFEIKTFDVDVTVGAGGNADNQSATVEYGDDYVINFTPNIGYEILDVKVDGVSVGAVNTYTLNDITANHTIEVSFKVNTYGVTVIVGQGGTADKATSTVEYGEDFAVNFTPATGYEIADVKVDGVSVGAVSSYEFTDITAAHTIEVSFKKLTFTVTVTVGEGGTANVQSGVYEYGEEIEIEATANEGMKAKEITVNGVVESTNGKYTLTVTENAEIEISFEEIVIDDDDNEEDEEDKDDEEKEEPKEDEEDEKNEAPNTGDINIALIATLVVLSLGATVVLIKKKATF